MFYGQHKYPYVQIESKKKLTVPPTIKEKDTKKNDNTIGSRTLYRTLHGTIPIHLYENEKNDNDDTYRDKYKNDKKKINKSFYCYIVYTIYIYIYCNPYIINK
jgi:hypothetical protein